MGSGPRPQKKIIFIIPYFGRCPEWFPLYLESCRWNPTIDWLFYTDCLNASHPPDNVRFIQTSYADYCQLISQQLGISFSPDAPAYKLSDIRPALGVIHQDQIQGYDYVGFGDVDVIYGDIRAIYTDDVLRYNTISTHNGYVSGHFFLISATERWINAFRQIPEWQRLMSDPINQGVDEFRFSKLLFGPQRLTPALRNLWGLVDPYKYGHLTQERYSTVFAQWRWIDGSYHYPNRWYWKQGKLTTEMGGEFLYLHFMNWKSRRYLRSPHTHISTWEALPRLIDPALTDFNQGWCISSQGFTPLPPEAEAVLQPLLVHRQDVRSLARNQS